MSKGMEIKQEERYSVKKNNKKQKKDKLIPSKEIDMLKFKQKIAYEMANIPIITLSNCIAQKDISNNDVIEIYSEKYKKYISEDFNTMCIVFINRLISESKTLPLSIKNFEDVHKTLLKIVKELMMNEYEITLLSLLLDKLSWSYQNVPFEDNIFYMGLTIKENSMKNESDFLFNYFSFVNKKCMEHYPQWKKDYYEKITFNCDFGEVYSRFSLLKQPYNIYCKTNYIDYNNVVDKILRMSLPYNESNKEEDDISITEKKNIKKPINAPIIQNNTIAITTIAEMTLVNILICSSIFGYNFFSIICNFHFIISSMPDECFPKCREVRLFNRYHLKAVEKSYYLVTRNQIRQTTMPMDDYDILSEIFWIMRLIWRK